MLDSVLNVKFLKILNKIKKITSFFFNKAFVGFIFFNDKITGKFCCGILFILIGVWLITRSKQIKI